MAFIDFYWSNWSWYKVEPVVHYSKLILHCHIRCELLYNIIHIVWSISRDKLYISYDSKVMNPRPQLWWFKRVVTLRVEKISAYVIFYHKKMVICNCATRWHRCKDKICMLFFLLKIQNVFFFVTINMRIIIVLTFESL